jgi:type 2 lantibiotic biosynthesis protein LanM
MAVETARHDEIDRMLGGLVGPALTDLAARLRGVRRLGSGEQGAVVDGVARVLRTLVWRHVRRVVLVELHAARLSGQLTAGDPRARWQEWVETLAAPGAWKKLTAPYPDLLPRLRVLIGNRGTAAGRFAERFATDRAVVARLAAGAPTTGHQTAQDDAELVEFRPGAGDSHRAGQTVAVVGLTGGRVVYKPRSMRVDTALQKLLDRILAEEPAGTRIRVPRARPATDGAGEYGWAAHVEHRYCRDDDELRAFYRGLGQWLAVMRLLGGSDLHSENVIADGPVPVVVDCETLFTPYHLPDVSTFGQATELAVELLGRSVLRTGLLPGRGAALALRGADISAAGGLPGQQPTARVATIVDHGTDRARLATVEVPAGGPSDHLPGPEPDLGRYWEHVVTGFTGLSRRIRALDDRGDLVEALAGFAGTPVRVVTRDTTTYGELMQMLWHPSALFEPEPAVARAVSLLARQAANRSGAPDDPQVIAAEVEDLRDGDVPMYTTSPGDGVLAGPRGTRWGEPQDLVGSALRRWRMSDLGTDRKVIRATLVSAYLNEGWESPPPNVAPPVRASDLDLARRRAAASIMAELAGSAIRGRDGTVTWVAPMLDATGWSVLPTTVDVYNGAAGVAIVLAGYVREVECGRADPVPGLPELRDAVVRSWRMTEDALAGRRLSPDVADLRARPDPPGGYLGLGGRIWAWLLLHRLGAVPGVLARQRAEAAAALLPEAVAADEAHDMLLGSAGALVPLLRLAEHTGNDRWRQVAGTIVAHLRKGAEAVDGGACWRNGPGTTATLGMSHGAFGIGWALARYAHATGDAAAATLAGEAFAWADGHYDLRQGRWRDPRGFPEPPRGWCHGPPGFGLCAADLLATGAAAVVGGPGGVGSGGVGAWQDLLDRAINGLWPEGLELAFNLCHGDLGTWETVDRARAVGAELPDRDRADAVARILGGIVENGPATGLTRDVFQPGLLIGSGGVAYQLLRLHPECDLPSVLLPDPGPAPT